MTATAQARSAAAVVRETIAAFPEGTMFLAATWRTVAGGADADDARERRSRVVDELRYAARDRKVKSITVLVLYEGE
jgi:hypothetical protein